jgi:type II secretory pathway pseudopilin PulG
MLSYHSTKNSGFTLVEFIVYIGILSIVISGVVGFSYLAIKSRIKSDVIATVEMQGARVSSIIGQTVRNAKTITSPAAGASGSSLTITVVDGAKSPTVFDMNTGALRIKEDAAANVNLTSSHVTASALTFTNLSQASTTGTIKYQFTLTYNNPGNALPYNYAKTFYGSATLRANP